MSILMENTFWMSWNLFLAFVGLTFAYLFVHAKERIVKAIFAVMWLLFVPNTIYVVTDLVHIFWQAAILETWQLIIMALQFIGLVGVGLYTYLLSLQLIEQELFRWKQLSKKDEVVFFILIGINFLIALGVGMGRVQRTNSWYIITEPIRVFQDFWVTIFSLQLMTFVLLFGLGINCLYFGLRRYLTR